MSLSDNLANDLRPPSDREGVDAQKGQSSECKYRTGKQFALCGVSQNGQFLRFFGRGEEIPQGAQQIG
jgi:hypothetical protein